MQSLAQIGDCVRGFPEPANYFRGVPPALPHPPAEVLMFIRKKWGAGEEKSVHYRFVLITPIVGAGSVIVDGRMFRLYRGTGILLFPHQCHHFAGFEKKAFLWLFTTFETQDTDPLLPLRDHPFELSDEAVERLAGAAAAFRGHLRGRRLQGGEINLWLGLLLSSLLRGMGRVGRQQEPFTGGHAVVQEAAAFIHHNVGRTFGVADVARHAAMSESNLRRVFRNTLGISLGTYIRQTRLSKACGLLHAPELNVTAVSEACGFTSLFAFSRAFKHELKVSPLAYRQKRSRLFGGHP